MDCFNAPQAGAVVSKCTLMHHNALVLNIHPMVKRDGRN